MLKFLIAALNVGAHLLAKSASKHAVKSNKLSAKARQHYRDCEKAAAEQYEREARYRHGLDQQADIHQRHADIASSLASQLQATLNPKV